MLYVTGGIDELDLQGDSADCLSIDEEKDKESFEVENQKGWNFRFQNLLEESDSVQKWEKIARLARDFIEVSSTYGKIIISEAHLPDSKKTVRPLLGSGVAGGSKYLVQDIFFKFSLDSDLGSGRWLYGKSQRNDEKAMKSAKSELKGASSLFRCNLQGIRLPLLAVIYYRGYCLVAESKLPINTGTIVYGSHDGGRTVFSSDEKVNGIMKSVGESLNLSRHVVQGHEIYGPGDIEVHKGLDDHFYLIDFGRLFPPEPPFYEHENQTNYIFHSFLRPTLVKKNQVPLCSDGLSAWCKDDPSVEEYVQHLQQAKKHLMNTLIPEFASYLEKTYSSIKSRTEFKHIIFHLHRKGINIRHLGYIRCHLKEKKKTLGRYLLTECTARSIKHELKELIRSKTLQIKEATVEPFLDEIFNFISPILYSTDTFPKNFIELRNWELIHSKSTRKKNIDIFGNVISVSKSLGGNNVILIADNPIPSGVSTYFFDIHIKVLGHIKIGLSEGNHLKSSLFRYDILNGIIEEKGVTVNVKKGADGNYIGVFYSAWDKTIIFTIDDRVIGYKIKKVDLNPALQLYPILWFSSETDAVISFNFGPKFYFPVHILNKIELQRKSTMITANLTTSVVFWKESIKRMVESRFPALLTEDERSNAFDLRKRIDFSFLICRLHKISGILFSDRLLEYTNGKALVVDRNDLLGFKPRVFHMGIVEYAEALSVLFRFQKLNYIDKQNNLLLQELKKAGKKLSRTFESAPVRSIQELFYCASIWYEIGLMTENDERKIFLEKAAEMIIESEEVNNSTLSSEILVLQGKIYCELAGLSGSFKGKQKYFAKAKDKFHLGTSQNESLVNVLLGEILHYMLHSNYVVNGTRLREQAQLIWESSVGNKQNTFANIQLFYIICLASAYTEEIPDENQMLTLSMDLVTHSVKIDKKLVEAELSKALLLPIHGNALFFILQAGLRDTELLSVLLSVIVKGSVKLTEYTPSLDRFIINLEKSASNTTRELHQFIVKLKEEYSYSIQKQTFKKPRITCSVSVIKDTTLEVSSSVLARSLANTPYSIYHTGNKKKEEKLGWYYKKCIQYSFRYGRSYNVSNSEEKVVGVIIWQHPHETNASLSRMIEVGMSDMPRVFGFEGTYKFSVSFKSVQQKRKELMKKEEHMYLFAIGVDPPYQRQGYGSALIQPLLKEADDSNLKCFLECSIAESVSFFKKWGFQVIEEVSKHHTGCLTYEMVRKPKSEQ
eukprot:TRINITY_DN15696_c0_g1_i1.p1 TRINITY_DN15696_c0_g1~~TRINITY_DN15696_c0_g1_i1.p1  ORF type:complete len:1232 (+),score=311.07 TRINITY_DN15696_c0_g1_i1:15-3710(+)